MMSEIREYRGVGYSIPSSDSGNWHYKIHPRRMAVNVPRPEPAPTDGYPSRESAIEAAEQAIDAWLALLLYR